VNDYQGTKSARDYEEIPPLSPEKFLEIEWINDDEISCISQR
jgi:hypothetical protein